MQKRSKKAARRKTANSQAFFDARTQPTKFADIEVAGGLQLYRHGNSPIFYPIKMPGLGKVGNVTMRKGIFIGDARFAKLAKGSGLIKSLIIELIDAETSKPIQSWSLERVRRIKLTGVKPAADGQTVEVRELQAEFEKLTVLK